MAVIRVSRLWSNPSRAQGQAAAHAVAPAHELDGLDAFGSESEPPAPAPVPVAFPAAAPVAPAVPAPRSKAATFAVWAAVIVLVATVAAAGTWQYQRRLAPAPGTLTIQSTPPGAEVVIKGAVVGRTPLAISVEPGLHAVQVTSGTSRRDLAVTMVAGGSVVHQLEFAAAALPVAPVAAGALHVQTDPARMLVAVDGVDRGSAPLTIEALQPGDHQVVVRSDTRTVRRSVTIKAGETFALVVSALEPSAPAPGWLAVTSPVTMHLKENGQLIGTSETQKLMLAAGDHDIELVNDALGYRTTRRINVAPNKTTTAAVELPSAMLSLNAQPWAEVWLDGERVGETPIANLATRIGTHEVVFRHPQLGERRQTVLVTLREVARLGIDMRRQ